MPARRSRRERQFAFAEPPVGRRLPATRSNAAADEKFWPFTGLLHRRPLEPTHPRGAPRRPQLLPAMAVAQRLPHLGARDLLGRSLVQDDHLVAGLAQAFELRAAPVREEADELHDV